MQSVQTALWVVMVLVFLALAFDFMNGFHDAANSIATVVSTGVLKPGQAVAFAAFFNVVAIFVFHLKVASTVGKGIVDPGVVDQYVVFGALVGAIAWNLVTWWFGIPSSSTHALVGGLIGAWNISAYHRGMMGGRTPNIDKLATQGALFTDYYAQQSCTAGRAAFILGQSPFRTGLLKVGLPGAKQGIQDKDATIAE